MQCNSLDRALCAHTAWACHTVRMWSGPRQRQANRASLPSPIRRNDSGLVHLSGGSHCVKLVSASGHLISFLALVFFVLERCFPNLCWGRGTFPLGTGTGVSFLLGNSVKWPPSQAIPRGETTLHGVNAQSLPAQCVLMRNYQSHKLLISI